MPKRQRKSHSLVFFRRFAWHVLNLGELKEPVPARLGKKSSDERKKDQKDNINICS
jgi:hypothetical protein